MLRSIYGWLFAVILITVPSSKDFIFQHPKEPTGVKNECTGLELTPSTTEPTKKSVSIDIENKGACPEAEKTLILGENTIKNNSFEEGAKYWEDGHFGDRFWSLTEEKWAKIKNEKSGRTRFGQPNILSEGLRDEYVVTISAKGEGRLNARFSTAHSSGNVIERDQELKSQNDFNDYVFNVPYDDDYNDELRIELTNGGEAYIESVEMHEASEVTEGAVSIHDNGVYKFASVDEDGEIIGEKSIEITNIDKKEPKISL